MTSFLFDIELDAMSELTGSSSSGWGILGIDRWALEVQFSDGLVGKLQERWVYLCIVMINVPDWLPQRLGARLCIPERGCCRFLLLR